MNPVGISLTVHTLVMVSNDPCDVLVRRDLAEDPLSNRGVLLHSPPLLESQRAFLA